MRRVLFVVAFLLGGCASAPQRDHTTAIAESTQQLNELRAKSPVPGMAIAVTSGDRIVWYETFGFSDAETQSAMTAESAFRIGSVTKLLTIAALMRLVEEKKVALDDPVSKHLPDFPHGAITLRQLAGHLGGIRHYGRFEFINTKQFPSAAASLAIFAKDPPLSPPGEKYFYSSYGYNVLGAVIEKVTGKTFPDALSMLVLQPLKMNETSFDGSRGVVTKFYQRKDASFERGTEVNLTDRLPSGAALASARDLARFLIAHTNHFFTQQSRDAMFAPQSLNDGTKTNVGLGWRVAKDDEGRTFHHHGGEAVGGRAFVLVYPAERVGVAFVSNIGGTPFNEKDAGAIARRFFR